MNKIIDYIIVYRNTNYEYSPDLKEFMTQVNDLILQGWQPFGNLTKEGGVWTQPMVKYEG